MKCLVFDRRVQAPEGQFYSVTRIQVMDTALAVIAGLHNVPSPADCPRQSKDSGKDLTVFA
jgi:hypothetical protein